MQIIFVFKKKILLLLNIFHTYQKAMMKTMFRYALTLSITSRLDMIFYTVCSTSST